MEQENNIDKINTKEHKEVLNDIKRAMKSKKIYMPKRYSGNVSLNCPGGLDDIIRDE